MTGIVLGKAVNKDFIRKIIELSGQNPFLCMQCGICTGACPMASSMDSFPRKVIRMIQLGLEERLKDLDMQWVCASCESCTVICPRGIEVSRVIEALRLIKLRRNVDHIHPLQLQREVLKEFPQIALIAAFRKMTS
jgi:heterodisulfide reductase subunit C